MRLPSLSKSTLQPLAAPRWLQSILGAAAGDGVRIGVVDSGVDSRLLLGTGIRMGTGADFRQPANPNRIADGIVDLEDSNGHGTACLTTACRMAPRAIYHPLRIFGEKQMCTVSTLVNAVDWATQNRLQIVNLSLRVPLLSTSEAEALFAACDRARSRGLIVVAAGPLDGAAALPAWFEGVLGVAGAHLPTPFDFSFHEHARVQITASYGINGEVFWLGGQRRRANHSSYAVPVVSAILALILSRFPRATPADVTDILGTLCLEARLP